MRIFNGAARNWGRLALRSGSGRVQLYNLLYDYSKRPATKSAVDEFFEFLESDYNFTLGVDSLRDSVMVDVSVGAIREFMSTSGIKVSSICPPVSSSAFKGRIGGANVCRFTRQDNAVRHYALYSNVCRQVDRLPKKNNPSGAANRLISDLGITASSSYRLSLVGISANTVPQGNRAIFFTFESALRSKPKRYHHISDATWACYQLGLLESAGGEPMVKVNFQLDRTDIRNAFRPTTFASGGYAAFCAKDHRDGFGRTQRLDVKRIMGIPEFVISQNEQPIVAGAEVVGFLRPATDGLVQVELITQHLRKISK